MTMADDDLSAEDQAAADTLMQELLDGGFKYEPNGRVAGFAGMPDEEGDDDGDDDGDGPVGGDAEGDSDGAATDGDGEPAGAGGDGGDVDGVGDGSRGAHSGRLELRGTPLTETEADGLLHLRKLLIDHPDLAVRINELAEAKLTGRQLPPEPAPAAQAPVDEPPAAPALPDFIDPDDPVAVGLWREVVDLRKGQERTTETVTTAVERAGQAKVQADIANALDRFKAAHPDLDDDDIRAIRDHTSASVNIEGVMGNFPGDPVEGLVRALEIGSMTDPVTRDKVLGVRDVRGAKDAKRQRSLSALSGGGGAASRRPAPAAKPVGWNDVSARLAEAIEKL